MRKYHELSNRDVKNLQVLEGREETIGTIVREKRFSYTFPLIWFISGINLFTNDHRNSTISRLCYRCAANHRPNPSWYPNIDRTISHNAPSKLSKTWTQYFKIWPVSTFTRVRSVKDWNQDHTPSSDPNSSWSMLTATDQHFSSKSSGKLPISSQSPEWKSSFPSRLGQILWPV